MRVSDEALETQVAATQTLRLLGTTDPSMRRLDTLMEHAVPFYWNTVALQRAGQASNSFPHDGVVLETDLAEPVQWWCYDHTPPGDLKIVGCLIARQAGGVSMALFVRVPSTPILPLATFHFRPDQPFTAAAGALCYPMIDLDIREPFWAWQRKFVASSILWLRSNAPVVERAEASRHLRKRASKTGVTHDGVRVITLRESIDRPAMTAAEHREWSCRWSVRGHWRDIVTPRTHMHRPVFVSPHVKGPIDKPFRAAAIRYNVTR